tara:strand:- start:1081 stop:1722 length:642 start_codon:yes stop_codon:yes gene_type:complete
MKDRIKICLIEDHKLMREGIKLIVNETTHIDILYEHECLNDFLRQKNHNELNLIILDLSLPDSTGILAIEKIKEKVPKVPILILTMHNESEFGIRAMKSGAQGYITKDNAGEELILAIDMVAKGKKYISREFSNLIAMNAFGDIDLPNHHQLSKREFDVLLKLGKGLSPTEISHQLDINIKTVSTYRNRILFKLNFENNADLTKYCLQNNLIT